MKMNKYFFKQFTPKLWYQNHRYCKCFDKWLNEALEKPKFEYRDGEYYVKLNGKVLWVANRPYSSPYPEHEYVRAKRTTILRFFDAYDKWRYGYEEDATGI